MPAATQILLDDSRVDIGAWLAEEVGIDGIMLAIRIRNKWPTIQIIITSGRPWPEEAVVPPDIPFFSKPYRQDRVLDAVRKMAA